MDAAQSIAHRPISMRGVAPGEEIDYLVFSGHKTYAPFGAGVMVAPTRRLEAAEPDLVGGGIVDLVTLTDVVWTHLPDREQLCDVLGAVAVGRRFRRLEELGRRALTEEEDALAAYALCHLATVPGLRVLGPPAGPDRVGVISFLLPGLPHDLVAAYLSYEHGIGVRSGCFCAHPGVMHLMGGSPEEAQTTIERMRKHERVGLPGAVRASLGLQNSKADVDRLVTALRQLVENGPSPGVRRRPRQRRVRTRGRGSHAQPGRPHLIAQVAPCR